MGARLRLKSSVDVTRRTSDPNMQRIFRAMQKNGLIVADNGSDMFITGTYDLRWDSDVLNTAFRALTANDFEIIQLGYNPPPETQVPGASVANLRASVRNGSLLITWDKQSASARYEVQVSTRLSANPSWTVSGQTGESSWTEPLDRGTGGQRFYRVLVLR
jgi:hypothetical protein